MPIPPPALLCLLFCLVIGDAPPAAPRPTDDRQSHLRTLLAAQDAYDQALALPNQQSADARRLYAAAADAFAALIDAGSRNGHLYFNLANAEVRLGRLGPAIADYRRALRLLPGDADVRENLDYARKLCQIRIPPPASQTFVETFFFWHFQTSPLARRATALGAYAAFWLLLAVGRWVVSRPASLVWTGRVAACVALLAGASVLWEATATHRQPEGVVVADEVVLRKGNGDYYDPALDRPLTPGVEFRVLETRDDVTGRSWRHIRLPDGNDGWLPDRDVELI